MDSYRHITVTRQGDIFCVRLKHPRMEETEIQQLGDELISLCTEQGCTRLALSLGPEPPYCLYSVFLAKLVAVRNALRRAGGHMVLCEVGPHTYSAFEACMLHREFVFVPTFSAAIASSPCTNDAPHRHPTLLLPPGAGMLPSSPVST